MKKLILILFLVSLHAHFEELAFEQKIVIATKQIKFEEFPDSHNPSLLPFGSGYLLSFRYLPDKYGNPWLNYIGLVLLNDSFDPIAPPQLIDTRFKNNKTQSQCEDARLFSYQGRIFLTYSDNMDLDITNYSERRFIYMTEVFFEKGKFTVSDPLKLIYEQKLSTTVQKNWVPFVWNQKLLFSYTVNPHEVIYPNLHNGICYPCYETHVPIDWEYGILRGSTPPVLVDGEYLAFFHSGIYTCSYASWGWHLFHYFTGAYTFSAKPPFEITRYTPEPIIGEDFYTQSNREKRVIFPGGFVATDSKIYMAYGKDDCEIWIATLDKEQLKKGLVPICKE